MKEKKTPKTFLLFNYLPTYWQNSFSSLSHDNLRINLDKTDSNNKRFILIALVDIATIHDF